MDVNKMWKLKWLGIASNCVKSAISIGTKKGGGGGAETDEMSDYQLLYFLQWNADVKNERAIPQLPLHVVMT
jgi:hypothetical protein